MIKLTALGLDRTVPSGRLSQEFEALAGEVFQQGA
jgi:hypothetical protein